MSSEEPQAPGSTAWKSRRGLPSMEGAILLTQESVCLLAQSMCPLAHGLNTTMFLINVEGYRLIREKVFFSSRFAPLIRYQIISKPSLKSRAVR